MKKYFILAAAALSFAACSSDDALTEPKVAQETAGEVPVAFDSYVSRGTTRAGLYDASLDINDVATAKVGFGVFAFYTNADNYDQSFTPNFMYNEQVTATNSADPTEGWVYSPVKFWPNEFGTTAYSDDADRISFFAYAPYVTVNPTSGKVNGTGTTGGLHAQDNGDITMGIVGMKRNNDTGDPMVKYISTFYTDRQVDLTWGTKAAGDWALKQGGNQAGFETGKPWLNVQHPTKTSTDWDAAQKVAFDFKHALASLNVTVDTYVNKPTPTAGSTSASPVEDVTRVYIRSVTFEGFDIKGALNLNNQVANEALWYNFDCVNELNNGAEITIKDGRKDGKEGLTAATKEYAAINPDFVQSAVWGSATDGVVADAANLFCTSTHTAPADEAPILVIPNGDPLKVTIEYDVLTVDANLSGILNDGQTQGSVVKNVITRYITNDQYGDASTGAFKMANGYTYTVKLHLGLNSVEFDAAVTPWPAASTGGADLPHNN